MGHAITFAQQKGGAGKTTVLAHLAAAWAEAGRQVALIDLDPQQSLTRWAKLRADPAIALIEFEGLPRRRRHQGRPAQPRLRAGRLPRRRLEPARERDPRERPRRRALPALGDGRLGARQSVVATAAKLKRPLRILLNRVPPRLGSLEEVLAALGKQPRAAARHPARQPQRLFQGDADRPHRSRDSRPAPPPPPRSTASAPKSVRWSPASDGACFAGQRPRRLARRTRVRSAADRVKPR